ncbi:hypothetical protein HXX76_004671 [Chlamydomonas incerta]|uniref:Gamma-tubulin complex component n=1 Tax=Chlamydomonas incerta TaxID=51695 RepID=A0A835T5I7_CHLIN|nr:hypothetical protein HXX76_004671 [Chlamydomonas incerta]|eukprot:KAG2439312.1 hypothetical protein HXX76_004671 [Chlamydomonas incerta]
MQSDVDSLARMKDQTSQELAGSTGAAGGEQGGSHAGSTHKDIIANLRSTAAAGPPLAGKFSAPSKKPAVAGTPPSISIPAGTARVSASGASLPPSNSTTPRGTGGSTGSTPQGGAGPGLPPSSAAPWGGAGGGAGAVAAAAAPSMILAKPAGAAGAAGAAPRPSSGLPPGPAAAPGAARSAGAGAAGSGSGSGAMAPSGRSGGAAGGGATAQQAGRGPAPAPAAGQQQAGRAPGAQQHAAAMTPTTMQTPPPPAGPAGQPGQQQPFATYQVASTNPVFNMQDTGMSPLTLSKREAYTPAMSDSMAAASRATAGPAAAQPPRGPGGGAGSARPSLPVPNPRDLFSPRAVEEAMRQRPNELQYLCELPRWTYARPSLTGLDLIMAAGVTNAEAGGAAVPPHPADVTPQDLMAMEQRLVNDLLHAFLGLTSQLVRPRLVAPANARGAHARGPCLAFAARGDLVHDTLRERVAPLLPICDYVAALQRFVETRSAHCYGMVTHALAAALRGYLEDWQVMVAMMENQMLRGALDLTRLTFYCQQPAAALAVLADVATAAADLYRSSADLLNLLYTRYNSCAGNGPGRSLLQHLLTAAAAPYCAGLEQWLRQGLLDDPYHEFMVQEDAMLRRNSPASTSGLPGAASRASSYWRGRYTLRCKVDEAAGATGLASPGAGGGAGGGGAGPTTLDIPNFVFDLRELILRTGKYQNLLRECGQPVAQPLLPQTAAAAASGAPPAPLPPLVYDPTQPGNLQQHVRAAHAAASSALLTFLLRGSASGGGGLLGVLRSVKHFFLLDQGDVLASIMEVADEELSKPAKAINRTRLQSLLEMAVKMSSAAADPHADSLGFEMDPRPLDVLARAVAATVAASAGPSDGSRGTSFTAALDTPYGTPGPASRGGALPYAVTPGGSRLLGPRDQDLPGWDLFLPTIKLDWPATLVVGSEELLQYQLLFKHMWGLKRVERQLEATWLLLQGTKRLPRPRGAVPPAEARRNKQLAVAHALCQQLYFTVQELLRYSTLDVLEPLWEGLEAGIAHRAADADAVIALHRDFLRAARSGLLLDQPRALECMLGLQAAAAGFARRMAALWDKLQAGVQTSSKAVQVTPADIAAEQQRAADIAQSLDDLQRLMGDNTQQLQELVAVVRDYFEARLTGTAAASTGGAAGGGLAGADAGGGGGGGLDSGGGWDLEALQNLADRLDFARPQAGTLGSVLAALVAAER